MATDIYRRVSELAADKRKNMSPKQFFESDEYTLYLKKKAENIISGSFHELRRQGFNVSEKEEKKLIRSLNVVSVWDPNSTDTAYCEHSPYGYTIFINTGNDLILRAQDLDAMHWCVTGLLYHEIGHLLYTDYPSLRAWTNQMSKGRFFPVIPLRIGTVTGVGLEAALDDEEKRGLIVSCGSQLENCLEDGYIEEEIRAAFPGKGRSALASINDMLLEGSLSLEEKDEDEDVSDIEKIFEQILLYAKFNEMNIGDYQGTLLDPIYEAVEIIDDVKGKRDPLARLKAVNELLCCIWQYVEDELHQEQPKEADNRDGQNGQGNGQGSGGAGSLADKLNKIAQSINKQGKDTSNGTHESVANPNKAKNAGAQSKVSASASQGGSGNGAGGSGAGGYGSDADMSAAKREVSNIAQEIAQNEAMRQAEKERCKQMNKEGQNMNISDLGINGTVSVSVQRAASVSESNKAVYEEEIKAFSALSKDLQRDIKRILKDRREGGKRKNLYFGKRLEIMSVMHDDGKYFSRNKLPTETPRLGVGVLVDESGSTSGALINAAMSTSIIIEDFCRQLSIPHIINGYTTGAKDCVIFSYAEPDEIDDSNRYRITGMNARGGTPTKTALAYMLKRMKKLPVDIRLLIVITDGQSYDNGLTASGEREITTLIKNAKKDKTIVVAAGIGNDRESVKAEFGENFMDISVLQDMPMQLIDLIKANLWV